MTGQLPHLQAALARRTQERPQDFTSTYHLSSDLNHPDITAGFTSSNTVRYAMDNRIQRNRSRSPTPGYEETFGRDYRYNLQIANPDAESALLINDETHDDQGWNEKLSSLGLVREEDTDLVLPPFEGTRTEGFAPGWQSTIYDGDFKEQDGFIESGDLADRAEDDGPTQHFGPAPQGRVGRRMNYAGGHRKFKQNAFLDDNGNYSQNLPIPERLASILPVKGVPEQECTRCVVVCNRCGPIYITDTLQ